LEQGPIIVHPHSAQRSGSLFKKTCLPLGKFSGHRSLQGFDGFKGIKPGGNRLDIVYKMSIEIYVQYLSINEN
jgi:hypothetical protein